MAYDWQSLQIIPEPNSGCWIWLGPINQHGYGRVRLKSGRSQVAHRAFYEAHHGIVAPIGMQIDHLCFLRCCVNPDHLEAVTPAVNTRRMFVRIRGIGSASNTHCLYGHELDEGNIWTRKSNGRPTQVCRTCAKQYRARYRNKQRISQ